MKKGHESMPSQMIVDENAGPGTAVWEQFQQACGSEHFEYMFLAETHPGIPDVEILDKLLEPGVVLLTGDCVLHMRALQRGYRSYTLNEQGQLTRKRLAHVRKLKPLPQSVHSTLQADYRQRPTHDLASRLKTDLTERQFKRYRTARRRIRSHVGSAAAISKMSVTVGAKKTPGGLLCGFVFHLAGTSGVKGLRASEGYCLARGPRSDATWPVLHALRDQYLLQLDQVRTDLFIIPPTSLELMHRLLENDQPASEPGHEAVLRLMRELPRVTLQPCVKGPFYDAMQARLERLTRKRSNEVTSLDFERIATRLLTAECTDPPSSPT
jgi:hypothetical protein